MINIQKNKIFLTWLLVGTLILSPIILLSFQKIYFVAVWERIDKDYLYAQKHKDQLNEIKLRYSEEITIGLSPLKFYNLLINMIQDLGDEHSFFNPPAWARKSLCLYPNAFGHGAFLQIATELDSVKILDVIPNSPADQAGLRQNDLIIEINGRPPITENGKIECIRPNANNKIITKYPLAQDTRNITLKAMNVNFPYPIEWLLYETSDGRKIGFIRILGFDKTTYKYIENSLQEMSAEGTLAGLILDLRFNVGGEIKSLEETLSIFTQGKQGDFISTSKGLRDFSLEIQSLKDFGDVKKIPLVILIGKETHSVGEIFSGVLKNSHNAYLIGEHTAGHTEALQAYSFIDGSFLFLSARKFEPTTQKVDFENGLQPDKFIKFDWYTYYSIDDPSINAGKSYIENLLSQ